MLIDRTTIEDISTLDLLVSKLEEYMNFKGIKFFDYARNEVEIDEIATFDGHHSRRSPFDDDYVVNTKEFKPRPIKRVKILFDSKADFHDRYSMDRQEIVDDGTYIGSFLHIEWDYITNMFQIYIGANTYEKESNSKNQKKVYRSDCTSANICLDFGLKYRREIRLIKVRLGKLYSRLIRDRAAEREAFIRKGFTAAAVSAFPDLLDPLILGGSLNEERNDRGISGEGRSGSEDFSTSDNGNTAPAKSI
jgi:hypothetical protein